MRRRSVVILLTSTTLLVAALASRPAPVPVPFLAAYGAEEVYGRKVPLSGKRDVITRAFTVQLDYASTLELLRQQLEPNRGWKALSSNPLSSTFSRGNKSDFEVIRVRPGRLVRLAGSDDSLIDLGNGAGWTTLIYARNPRALESLFGRMVSPMIEGRESKDGYGLVIPDADRTGLSGGSGAYGHLIHDVTSWTKHEGFVRAHVSF